MSDKKILVVDDSSVMRGAIRRILMDNGYTVKEASDGLSGISAFEGDTFSMIITDINMPLMNGLEMIEKIKQTPKGKFVPILMLTTESQQDKVQEAKRLGASAYLVKPFTESTILQAVKKLIR